ncbi:hypothetical protein ABK040_011913 [Willaertia magna]
MSFEGKFLIQQQGSFLRKGERKWLVFKNDLIDIDSGKVQIPFKDLINVATTNKSDEIIIEYSLKGKSNKETLTYNPKEKLLNWLYYFLQLNKQDVKDNTFTMKKLSNSKVMNYSLFSCVLQKKDLQNNQVIQLIDLLNVEKVFKAIVTNEDESKVERKLIMFKFTGNEKFIAFECQNADLLIQRIQKVRKELGIKENLDVQEVTFEEFESIRKPIYNETLVYTHHVKKLQSSTNDNDIVMSSRTLGINHEKIVEKDNENNVTFIYPVLNIKGLIRFHNNLFGLEYSPNKVRKYLVDDRDSMIVEFLDIIKHVTLGFCVDSNNNLLISKGITLPETSLEYMLKKLLNTLKDDAPVAIEFLREFNTSFSSENCVNIKEKSILKLLKNLLSKVLEDNKLEPKLKENYIATTLCCLQRVLSSPALFEELNSQKKIFDLLLSCLKEEKPLVKIMTAIVIHEIVKPIKEQEESLLSKKKAIYQQHIFNKQTISFILEDLQKLYNTNVLYSVNLLKSILYSSFNNEISSLVMPELFNMRECLYGSLFSKCETIEMVSSFLLSRICKFASTNQLSEIQNETISNGAILLSIFKSCFCENESDQVSYSKLCDLLLSFNNDGVELMKRVLPFYFMQFVNRDIKQQIVDNEPPTTDGSFFKKLFKKKSEKQLIHQVTTQDWKIVFSKIKENYANAAIIWDDKSREFLKTNLKSELDVIYNAYSKRQPFLWNSEEFIINYKSIIPKDEKVVGGYYLRFLADQNEDTKPKEIEDPLSLVKELYYTLLLSQDTKTRIECFRAMSFTYMYLSVNMPDSIFPYLDNIMNLFIAECDNDEIVYECLALCSSLFSIFPNIMVYGDVITPLLLQQARRIHAFRNITEEEKKNSHIEPICEISIGILYKIVSIRSKMADRIELLKPIPKPIRLISQDNLFPHLIQLLIIDEQKVAFIAQVVKIILFVLKVNASIRENIYRTGFFYFLLYSIVNENVPTQSCFNPTVSAILKLCINSTCSSVEEANNIGIDIVDPFLLSLIPESLLVELRLKQDVEFTELFNSNHDNPKIIWNQDMRKHLQSCIRNHVAEFKQTLEKDTSTIYQFNPLSRVIYSQIEKELYIENYYIRNLLKPEFRDFPITNPQQLFDGVVEYMSNESNEDNLIILLDTQLLLTQRFPEISKENYRGLKKLIAILSIHDRDDWNINLVSKAISILFLVAPFNKESWLQLKSSDVIVSLLGSVYRKQKDIVMNYPIQLSCLYEMLQGILEIIRSLELYDALEADPESSHVILHCLVSYDAKVFKSTTKLLRQMIPINPSFVRKLWKRGMLFFLIQEIISENPNEEQVMKTNECGNILTIIQSSVNEDYVKKDLAALVSEPLVNILLSNELMFLTQIRSTVENPELIWNENTRKQLQNHLGAQCKSLIENQLNSQNVIYEKVIFDELENQLQVNGVYVDIYNKMCSSYKLSNPIRFARGLYEFLTTLDSHSKPHRKSVCKALNNLCVHSNDTELLKLVNEVAVTHEAQNAIFNCLKLEPKVISLTSYHYLIDVLLMELNLKGTSLKDVIINNRYYSDLVFALNFIFYHYSNIKESHKAILSKLLQNTQQIINIFIKSPTEATTANSNGILLWELAIFAGFINFDKETRINACKTISQLILVSNGLTEATLKKILPLQIVNFFTVNPEHATLLFDSNNIEPDIVWFKNMRSIFINFIVNEMSEFIERYNNEGKLEWRLLEGFELEYPQTKNCLFVSPLYVKLLNERAEENRINYLNKINCEEFLNNLINYLINNKESENLSDVIFAIAQVVKSFPQLRRCPSFKKCTFTLFSSLDVEKSDLLAPILHILYFISSCNEEFVNLVAENKLIMKLFEFLPSHTNAILYILLNFLRNSSVICGQVISEKHTVLIEWLEKDDVKISSIAGFCLTALVMDPTHGAAFRDKFMVSCEKFTNYLLDISLNTVQFPALNEKLLSVDLPNQTSTTTETVKALESEEIKQSDYQFEALKHDK